MSECGILPVDKPAGLRSTDCVQRLRRILGRKTKIGHGGTLDSTASGLLLILVGQATRLSNFIMGLPKCYEAGLLFGTQTDTDDASGEVIKRASFEHLNDAKIESSLCGFMGFRMQRPPAVSAVHVDGTRAHALARGGAAVIPEAKAVCFSRIERLTDLNSDGRVDFRIRCRKGTYIRSFARDLGEALGTVAHICALRRTESGPFRVGEAKEASLLFEMDRESLLRELRPIETLLSSAASYEAGEGAALRLRRGQSVVLSSLKRISLPAVSGNREIVVTADGLFSICSAEIEGATLGLKPDVNLIADGGGLLA